MSLPVVSKLSDLKIPLRSEVLLSRYSTFQIGGPARLFAEPTRLEELQAVFEFAHDEGIPLLGIGKGSNVLFPDEGFPGIVLTFIHFEPQRIIFDETKETVTVSSGVNLYKLALATRNAGFGGVEFLGHIPGTVGGALMMNAGFSRTPGKKHEIGDLVESVTVLSSSGELQPLGRNDLVFQYRKTNLEGSIIVEARLKLYRSKPEEVQKEIQANFDYRNKVQDLRYPSAGSVFKNPDGGRGSAGQMIEKVGLKGKRIGGAMISDRHGNFIVNVASAKASDVLELISTAQEKVSREFDVRLEPEIRIIRGR